MDSSSERKIEDKLVSDHYEKGGILSSIRTGILAMGKDVNSISLDDLAPVDEFHIGGRMATKAMLDPLDLGPNDRVLDIGCGLGGTSRFVANSYGCKVDGIDLTPEFVVAGNELCGWIGLDEKVQMTTGNALDMPYEDAHFDAATMLHVGMNIPNKSGLFLEISRTLRPGGAMAIYDIMRVQSGELEYPVPWASGPEGCAIASQSDYRAAIEGAGFEVLDIVNRAAYAEAFFAMLKANADAKVGTPPLGLHLLMGERAPVMVKNMLENIRSGKIVPIEIVARKVG